MGRSSMRVKGCLNTHQKYDFNFDEKIMQGKRQLVGTCTIDGWWIKGEVPVSPQENFASAPPAPAETASDVDVAADAGGSSGSGEEKKDNDPLPAAPSTTDAESLPAGYFLCKSEGFTVMNTIVAAGFIDSVIQDGVKIIEE